MTEAPIKFLLVDDVPENLVALEALLRRDGLELLQARSGAQALELLLVHEFALALVDVQMPEMDGFELAELMRGSERTKYVPIIFVTAGAHDPQRVFAGYETGVIDFLFKPIDPHILRSKTQVFFDLARQRQELARALRLNEMFVAILGHDLRSPLNTISMSAQLLGEQLTDDKQVRTLARIARASNRMTEMIGQLLDLTRVRLGAGMGFVRDRTKVDLADLVRRTVDDQQALHGNRAVAIEVSGDPVAIGDAPRLAQLFDNLIANALRHGTPEVPIAVRLEGRPHEVVIQLSNGGVIDGARLPTIFDPFKNASERTSRNGLGLGLFIANQVAMAHGGGIAVVSTAAAGTMFTVTLPRRPPEDPTLADAAQRRWQ